MLKPLADVLMCSPVAVSHTAAVYTMLDNTAYALGGLLTPYPQHRPLATSARAQAYILALWCQLLLALLMPACYLYSTEFRWVCPVGVGSRAPEPCRWPAQVACKSQGGRDLHSSQSHPSGTPSTASLLPQLLCTSTMLTMSPRLLLWLVQVSVPAAAPASSPNSRCQLARGKCQQQSWPCNTPLQQPGGGHGSTACTCAACAGGSGVHDPAASFVVAFPAPVHGVADACAGPHWPAPPGGRCGCTPWPGGRLFSCHVKGPPQRVAGCSSAPPACLEDSHRLPRRQP